MSRLLWFLVGMAFAATQILALEVYLNAKPCPDPVPIRKQKHMGIYLWSNPQGQPSSGQPDTLTP
jgi:hypothetical protein